MAKRAKRSSPKKRAKPRSTARRTKPRKRKRKKTPNRHTVEKATKLLRRAHRELGRKARRTKAQHERRMQKVIDRYIKEYYIPKTGKDTINARERAHIRARTSLEALSRRQASMEDGARFRKITRGKNRNKYKVLTASGRLDKGKYVSELTVRRSMATAAYWSKVKMIAEVLEIKPGEAREILKLARDMPESDAIYGESP